MADPRQRYIIDFEDCPSTRRTMPALEPEKRRDNFEEVETGFTIEEAQEEARRCLSCRRCIGCGLCLAVCEPNAIVLEEEDQVLELTVDELIISPEVGEYMALEEGELGYATCENVVSAFAFERILNEDGPYGGLILRPFDGEIPENMAFILNGNGDRDDAGSDGKDLFSFALHEACSALEKVKDLRISVFVSSEADFGIPHGKEEKKGINIRTVEALEVKEMEDTKNLLVAFQEEGERRQEEFQLLVLSKPTEIRPELRALHEKLGTSITREA